MRHASDLKVQRLGWWVIRDVALDADNEIKIATVAGNEVALKAWQTHASDLK